MRAIKHRKGTCYREIKKMRKRKRHIQRLRSESIWAPHLNEEVLQYYGYYHERLGLHPWHWHHRQPPLQVRQLAVQHLLTTFFAWQKQLASLAEPYHLALWIVGPEFAHSSQVLVNTGELIAQQQSRFETPDPNGPPLPIEYHQLPGANLLTWQAYPWHIFLDDYDYPNAWPTWALRYPHSFGPYEDGSEYLAVQTGWMWVGQLPAQAKAQPTL
ncbi:hypothetical protein [Hymenobacter fodinae]|uniref:Uncharacterized protein n=1 Tax=Hymenobacter fodinae TaxID=2510796 RepID=A0A4Z0NZS9_9BACT|nr:hypothetical protein [Hymenobacter fodinae]TGE04212.1 hypothetical protein EU556_23365 [Hymenobacter fodinae]